MVATSLNGYSTYMVQAMSAPQNTGEHTRQAMLCLHVTALDTLSFKALECAQHTHTHTYTKLRDVGTCVGEPLFNPLT